LYDGFFGTHAIKLVFLLQNGSVVCGGVRQWRKYGWKFYVKKEESHTE